MFEFAYQNEFIDRWLSMFQVSEINTMLAILHTIDDVFNMFYKHFVKNKEFHKISDFAEKLLSHLRLMVYASFKQDHENQFLLMQIVTKFGQSKVSSECDIVDCLMIGINFAIKNESKIHKEAIICIQTMMEAKRLEAKQVFQWYETPVAELILDLVVYNYIGYSISLIDSLKYVSIALSVNLVRKLKTPLTEA